MYIKTTSSSTEIFTLDELKRYLVWNIGDDTRNADMAQCLRSATESIEGILGLSLRPHVWAYYQETWSSEVELLYGPFKDTTVVITYFDQDNAIQTLDPGEYLVINTHSKVILNGTLPTLYSSRPDNVKIVWTAAPELVTDIEQKTSWIRLMAGELFENPVNDKDELRKIAERIIAPIRSYI